MTAPQTVADVHTEWQFTVPDADQRRGRHIVAVVGTCFHSGMSWHRFDTGVAATLYEGRQGYRAEDIAAIEASGGMNAGTGVVVAWMDYATPPLPIERQDFDCALPFPLRAAATSARQGETK